ncbi:MAG: Hpt domain-containing protein, partial [Nitrospirales bacterium]
MADEFDHGSLIPVFLEEAREELRQLRTALASEEGAIPRQLDVRPLYLVAHTLRGSASMYGFRDVAELAGLLESRLEDSRELTDQEWHDQVFVLRELIDALEVQLQAIDRSGAEIAGMVDEWQARLGTPPPDPLQPEATPAQPESPAPDLPDEYLLPDVEPELLACFAPEAQEYLQAMEQGLLRLEQNASDPETIQQLFRSAHTLKGSAYTVGFQSVGDVTHHLEDVMGAIREGRKSVTPELTDLLFKAVDLVRLLMRRDPASLALVRGEFTGVTCRLEQECREEGPVADAEQVQVTASLGEPGPAEPVAIPGQPAEDPVVKPETGSPPASESAVIRVSRDRLERLLNLVGELVISRGRLEQRLLGLERLSAQVQACKARMIDTVRTFEEKHAFTLPTVSPGAAPGGASSAEAFMDFGALEFDKYDDFNILARRISEVSADVGESMAQLSGSIRKAREDMSQLQRLSVSMRDEIARSRMVPIGTPFTRFRRAAREMARATGKEVTVSMSGEQTEV